MTRPYKVLFLLGLMRSGTTFFRNLLSANPSIQVLGSELNRFWTETGGAPSGTVPECPYLDESQLREEVRVRVLEHFDRWYRRRNGPDKLLYRTYRKLRYGNERIVKRGAPFYLLNKSTHLANKIRYLDALFPHARYIFLVRDIYSHANSLKKHFLSLARKGYEIKYPGDGSACWQFTRKDQSGRGKPPLFDFAEIPRYWIEHNLYAMHSLDARAPDRVLYVGYEDLVERLPGVLDRLDTFLELDLNRAVDTRLVNNYTSRPLRSWKDELSSKEKEIVERAEKAHPGDTAFIRERIGFRN